MMTPVERVGPRSADSGVVGLRVLVVEDEAFVAQEIVSMLEELHCEVVGPFPRVDRAREVLAADVELDGALLDINLNGEFVYPLADELLARGIPFIFASGYDSANIPQDYVRHPRLEKPFGQDELRARMWQIFVDANDLPR